MSGEFAGTLRERVTITAPTEARTSSGVQQFGWHKVADCLASIVPEGAGAEAQGTALSALPRFMGRSEAAMGSRSTCGCGGNADDGDPPDGDGPAHAGSIGDAVRGGAVMNLNKAIERGLALVDARVEERLAEAEAILNEVSTLRQIQREATQILATGPDLMRVMLESPLRTRGWLQ